MHDDHWCWIDPCEDCIEEQKERDRYMDEQADRSKNQWELIDSLGTGTDRLKRLMESINRLRFR